MGFLVYGQVYKALLLPIGALAMLAGAVGQQSTGLPTFVCPADVSYRIKISNSKHTNATISCQASPGYTTAGGRWSFNHQPITASSHYQMTNLPSGTVTLTVVDPTKDDGGRYHCAITLTDANGVSYERSAHIKVESHPAFSQGLPKSYELDQGEAAEMECIEAGSYNTILSWLRDGAPFAMDGSRIYLAPNKESQDNGILVIKNMTYDDRATYTCVATNDVGSERTSTLLRVKNPVRWVWPFIGILVALVVVAAIVAGSEYYKKLRPNQLQVDQSSDSLPHVAKLDLEETVIHTAEADMLARVTALGYPPSVIDAAIKWRSKTEARKLRMAKLQEQHIA